MKDISYRVMSKKEDDFYFTIREQGYFCVPDDMDYKTITILVLQKHSLLFSNIDGSFIASNYDVEIEESEEVKKFKILNVSFDVEEI